MSHGDLVLGVTRLVAPQLLVLLAATAVDRRQVRGSSAWVSMMCMATSTSR